MLESDFCPFSFFFFFFVMVLKKLGGGGGGGGGNHAVTMASAAYPLLSLEKQIPPCRVTRAGLQFTLN